MINKIITKKGPGWVVYMLACRDGSFYTGVTNGLERRLDRHRKGTGSRFVRSRLPFRLVRVEKARGKGQALRREAEIKGMTREQKEMLVSGRGR